MSQLQQRRRRIARIATLLCVGAALGAAWLLPAAVPAGAAVDETVSTEGDDGSDALGEVSTVQPVRQDLSIGHEASGSIAASATQSVLSPADGTLVTIVETGVTVGPGDVIAVVDDHPVSVIEGTIPMWRDLGIGDEGADVRQLESALVALGFDPDAAVTVDEEYTSATSAMVSDWQTSIGAADTGTVGRTDVVVLAAPMTVASIETAAGAAVAQGQPLVGLDSLERVVIASIPVADAVTLAVGDQVDLRFPDRTSAAGEVRSLTLGVDTAVRIADIAFVETDDAEGDEEEGGVGRTFEGVTVDVTWDEIVAIDVLTIPADTFRHLDDGTYVVDVRADDGTIVALAVEPGRQVGTSVEVAAIPVDAEIVQR